MSMWIFALRALFLTALPQVRASFYEEHNRCVSGQAGRCVQVMPPFAEAALWAASLIPRGCDTQAEECMWRNVPFAWRYAWNNLRLAMEGADAEFRSMLDQPVLERVAVIHSFFEQMGFEEDNWFQGHQAGAEARQLLEHLGGWLRTQRPANAFLVPPANHGLNFPKLGRSVQVATNGDIGARVTLSNGVAMPVLGLGVWQLASDGTARQSVRWALELGYRHIDTAQGYRNEPEVGMAMQESQVPREEIFLVTKLTMPEEYYGGRARTRFMAQLADLQVDYVDVYMLHGRGIDKQGRMEAWRDMEDLYDEGRIRALGVSNFDIWHLEELLSFARIPPHYIQNKYSIYCPGDWYEALQDTSIMEWLNEKNIVMTGYSTIHPGHASYLEPLSDPHVVAIGNRIGRTPSQVMHRWLLQLGAAVIPRSTKFERIRENAQIFDFVLDDADMRLLNGLASLMASTQGKLSPRWSADVYGVTRVAQGE